MRQTLRAATVLVAWIIALAAEPATVGAGMIPDFGIAPTLQPMKPANDKERRMPEEIRWLNSEPLSAQPLRGKVVLVDFWTYSCINSLRNLPYIKHWAAKYKAAGLVVIGVHTPEFTFEKDAANVGTAVRDLRVTYPVAIDSNYQIWQAFGNEYWPADYMIDGKGRIRYRHFGEGGYVESERMIQRLLKENGADGVSATSVREFSGGAEAAPNWASDESPETYIGYRHGYESFTSPERLAKNVTRIYSAPRHLALNTWGLSGTWNVGAERAVLTAVPGTIAFRFHSRDLHLVLGPTKSGKPVRFRVRLDGAAPGDDHGTDTAPDGSGAVKEPRLYQLIRQGERIEDRTFEIRFLDPGVQAFVFTFG